MQGSILTSSTCKGPRDRCPGRLRSSQSPLQHIILCRLAGFSFAGYLQVHEPTAHTKSSARIYSTLPSVLQSSVQGYLFPHKDTVRSSTTMHHHHHQQFHKIHKQPFLQRPQGSTSSVAVSGTPGAQSRRTTAVLTGTVIQQNILNRASNGRSSSSSMGISWRTREKEEVDDLKQPMAVSSGGGMCGCWPRYTFSHGSRHDDGYVLLHIAPLRA